MTAVVTGAAGFIGRHLVAALVGRGTSVVGIDCRPGTEIIADLAAPLGPEGAHVAEILRSASAVYHLAGRGGVRGCGPDAEAGWWRDNVVATQAVLAAVPLGTPVVVTSSSSVYGGAGAGRPCREGDRLAPIGGYARSKVAAEQLCAARVAAGGLVAVARPFTVVGEGQRPDMAFSRWIDSAGRGEPLVVYGSLDRRRDLTDVHDVVRALVAMGDRRVTGAVNVGTGTPQSLRAMLDAVTAVMGDTGIIIEAGHPDEVEATWADTTRCRQRLGFRPNTDLADVVSRHAVALRPIPA